MPAGNLYIRELLHAYAENKISARQTEELFQYLNTNPGEAALLLTESAGLYEGKMHNKSLIDEEVSNRMKQLLLTKISTQAVIELPRGRPTTRIQWAAAAAVLLLTAGISYFLVDVQPKNNPDQNTVKVHHLKKDATPGIDGAVLTTASGDQILLDNAANGVVASEKNTHVLKQGSQLIYSGSGQIKDDLESLNTLSTLKGRKFQLVLADGTKVWLDAASSITYPVVFTGKQRKVKVTGQLYFEVAKDKSKPFIVEAGETSIKVYGTHFNVDAYEDEPAIKTTLLEGSVKISVSNQSLMLKAGQQAVSGKVNSRSIHLDKDVDTEAVIAWKSGLFQFDNADLPTVLRQLARWYDMQIVYFGEIPIRRFDGKIGRDLNLSQVLKLLEKMQVRFSIKENKLIVQP